MTKISEEHAMVWTLVDLPKGKKAIGTNWVYRNKKDERGIVVRNKERLVAQGYTQEEGIDYDPVARIKAIRYNRIMMDNLHLARTKADSVDVQLIQIYALDHDVLTASSGKLTVLFVLVQGFKLTPKSQIFMSEEDLEILKGKILEYMVLNDGKLLMFNMQSRMD
ncbi:putative ribonuclease H-like domain-containing protein [Tanacetum coccineum]